MQIVTYLHYCSLAGIFKNFFADLKYMQSIRPLCKNQSILFKSVYLLVFILRQSELSRHNAYGGPNPLRGWRYSAPSSPDWILPLGPTAVARIDLFCEKLYRQYVM